MSYFWKRTFRYEVRLIGDTHLYEMEDSDVGEGVRIIDSTFTGPDNIESLTPLEASGSGSENLLDHVPMEQEPEQSQPQCSNHNRIPRCRFEIEGGSFHDFPS